MATLRAPLARGFDAFIRRPAWWPLLLAFWALVTAASFTWHVHELESHAHAMAAQRGRLVFEMVELTRLWATQHGGVYVPVTEKTPPNPWLDVPEKTVATPAGRLLTQINPAYMTRQLGELIAAEQHDMRIHLTSLKPVNPGNAPDEWERQALAGFETSRGERISIVGAGDTAIFRYMAPLEVKESCMACHEQQGYRVGGVRGGLGVSFPARYIYGIVDAQKRDFLFIHLAAFALFALAAWGSLWLIRRHVLALEAARAELVESEKMASLGRMVAGFAHEVNTPVGVAVGAVSHAAETVREIGALLSHEEVTEEDLRARLGTLDEATGLALSNLQRAAGMVRSFKRTAVDQASDSVRDYDLAETVADVVQSLQSAFKTTAIRIESEVPALKLHGPAGALQQILINLLQNSHLHAYAGGTGTGTIHIAARAEGDDVLVDYRDDGAGMGEETLRRIFEPFYTTARGSGGSGLGLYIAYNLATQALGGSIECESRPGQGACFMLRFPARRTMTTQEVA